VYFPTPDTEGNPVPRNALASALPGLTTLPLLRPSPAPQLPAALPDGSEFLLERSDNPAARNRVAKRALDLTVACLALLAALPLALVIALAVFAHDRGPVFFRQTRVGLDGQPFRILKFRSMCVDAESRRRALMAANEADGPLFKIRHDPRVTRVGRVLRRHSLDELPQLLNVIQGSMSLVGPRPALPGEVEFYDAVAHGRLRVKPGITGAWQVHGRTDLSWEEGLSLDLEYARNWSLTRDVAILARTARVVASAKGGY
jgi:lipopolysaccharide/colanic/teichoic acid biosynthesis glycosyltransferase